MEEQVNLLAEDETIYERATTGARFANYAVDIVVYFILLMAVVFTLTLTRILVLRDDDNLLSYVVVYTVLIGYYTITEGLTGGKTIGKYLTGTRAVKEDGSRLTFGDAFLRTLCRIIPFEAFSAFGGNPWHDRWTKTTVVKEGR